MNMTYFGLFSEESFQYKQSLDKILNSITLDSSILIKNCIAAIRVKDGEVLVKKKEPISIEVATNTSGAFIIDKANNKALSITDGNFFIFKDGIIIHTDFNKRFIEVINISTPSNFDILDAMDISTITVNNGNIGINITSESYIYKREFNSEDISLVYKTRLTDRDVIGKINIKELLNMI